MEWTKEQKQAIEEKDSNILVAAAAGSGKTAVLVERIIKKVLKDGIDIDKLLVVTFTNAAAAEMRERVLDAIYKKLDDNPNSEKLLRQITLLNKASICTIDSFCLDVVRNNFYELENLSPNFRIADTTEIELLKQEVIEDLFERKYEEENEDFTKLIHTYTSYKDDTPLKDLILKIYNYIQSNPFPEKWLREKIEMFNINLFSGIFILRTLLKKRYKNNLRSIVFISSISSSFGSIAQSAYCSSKAAIEGFVRAAAVELAPTIRVNTILPGGVEIDWQHMTKEHEDKMKLMTPLGFGKPKDIAHMTEYLMSEKSCWITGQSFIVDGGYSINGNK